MKLIFSIARIANLVTMAALLAMMLLTVADVFLRFVFQHPILGTTEIIEYMMVCMVFLGIAYCAVKKKHVSVDILTSRFSHRVQSGFNVFNYILGIGIIGLITWRGFVESATVWREHITSGLLQIPTFPFYAILAFGSALLCLVMLCDLIQYFTEVTKR